MGLSRLCAYLMGRYCPWIRVNLFLKIFAAIDIVFIIKVLLSLMALIFAYDAIAGEHESGTLRLVSDTSYQSGPHSVRQIHQRNVLSSLAIAGKFFPCKHLTNSIHLYFHKHW